MVLCKTAERFIYDGVIYLFFKYKSKVKLYMGTIFESNPKAPFSIATTPSSKGGGDSFTLIDLF